jgi:4'-phosphopantetheinyl transferase
VICEIYLARLWPPRPEQLALLDESEQARSARFSRPADRDRFTLGAVLLRLAAGQQLAVPAASVRVDRCCADCGRQHGRPVLDGAGIHASVSHSGDCVAVALTAAGPAGLDVEAVTGLDYEPMLAAVCTPAEREQVRSAADFYSYWTRKEAVLKATGEGLRRPMTDLTVSAPADPPALTTLAGRAPPPCQLADIPAGAGYRAAAAVLTAGQVEFSVTDAAQLLGQ